jgi:hypothetical protein
MNLLIYFLLDRNDYEHNFIEKIVKDISDKINHVPLYVSDYLVGLKSRISKVISLLDSESNDGVCIIGIHGTGGICLLKLHMYYIVVLLLFIIYYFMNICLSKLHKYCDWLVIFVQKGNKENWNHTFKFPLIQNSSRFEWKGIQKDEKSQDTYH